MAEINESVYGASENWVDAISYPSGATDSEKLKFAYFSDDAFQGSRIKSALSENKLSLNTPWDNSLSYCGLGSGHPLSKITWYIVEGSSEVGQTNILQTLHQEQKDVTNFALGTTGEPIYGPTQRAQDCYITHDDFGVNKFYYSRWNNNPVYSDEFSNYWSFQPFTQLPLHRIVLCPVIVCSSNDSDDIHHYDLNTYLSGDYKTNYPRVRQINADIYVDYLIPYESQGVVRPNYNDINIDWKAWEEEHPGYEYRVHRQALANTNGLPVLDTTSAFNDIVDDTGVTPVTLNDVYLPMIAGHADGTPGITIAGHLWAARAIPTNNATSTRIFGVASGFGLNFTEVAHHSQIRPEVIGTGAFLYCDASQISDNAFREAVRNMIACFGLFFVDSASDATLPLDHERMMLGVLNNGIGEGQYVNGEYNRDYEQWKLTDAHDVDYDPSAPTPPSWDPNAYLDTMKWGSLENFSTAIDRYNIKGTTLTSLTHSLWELWDDYDLENVDIDSFAKMEIEQKKKFLTNNPIDCITGIKYFPISEKMYESATNYNIKVGTVVLTEQPTPALPPVNITGKLAKNSIHFDCGRVYCSPQYQTLDNPNPTWIDQYVSFELYLPFCGSVKLDTATYIGKWVNVEYDIDLITGCCCASIGIASSEVSGYEFMEIRNGQCCIDVPITGIQQSTLEANLFNAVQGMKLSKSNYNYQINSLGIDFASNAVSALTNLGKQDFGATASSALGAVKGFMAGNTAATNREINVATENYNLTHTQLPTRLIGTAGSLNSAECYLKPMLIVTKPVLDIPSNYGETTGYACLEHTTVGALGGYTECTNVKLDGFNCTETEKEMIRSLLAGGVYV